MSAPKIWGSLLIFIIFVILIVILIVMLLKPEKSSNPVEYKRYDTYPLLSDQSDMFSFRLAGNSISCVPYQQGDIIPYYPLARLLTIPSRYCLLNQPTQYGNQTPGLLYPQTPQLNKPLTWSAYNTGWLISLDLAQTVLNIDYFFFEITNGTVIYSLKTDRVLGLLIAIPQERDQPLYYIAAHNSKPDYPAIPSQWFTATELVE